MTTYTDESLTFDPDGPFEMQYPDSGGGAAMQARFVPDSLRELAAPLTLPDTITGHYHPSGDSDYGQPSYFTVDLDPELNEGYVKASFHAYHSEGRGFSIQVDARPGEWPASLFTCPTCGSPWARGTQEAYGNASDCEACGYHDYFSIGD